MSSRSWVDKIDAKKRMEVTLLIADVKQVALLAQRKVTEFVGPPWQDWHCAA